MFILRRVLKDGTEENTEIGDYYRLLSKKSSPDAFDKFVKENNLADTVYAVVQFEPMLPYVPLNETYMPIIEEAVAYIMGESGQTFARIN